MVVAKLACIHGPIRWIRLGIANARSPCCALLRQPLVAGGIRHVLIDRVQQPFSGAIEICDSTSSDAG